MQRISHRMIIQVSIPVACMLSSTQPQIKKGLHHKATPSQNELLYKRHNNNYVAKRAKELNKRKVQNL